MKISLIGYMGAGKTSLGKALAASLDLPFYDLDHLIAEKHGLVFPFKKKRDWIDFLPYEDTRMKVLVLKIMLKYI